jgi:tRNA A37 N6-isopentenylltransferase MiaA
LLVFSFLIIIHNLQIKYGSKPITLTDNFTPKPVDQYVIVFFTTHNQQLCPKILQMALEQTVPAKKVLWIDTQNHSDLIESATLEHFHVKPEEVISTFVQAVKKLEGRTVVVQLDCHKENVHHRVLEKLDQIFANQSVWLVYADNRLYPSKMNPKWKEAGLKAFYAHLVSQLDVSNLHTIDDVYKNLFFLGNGHHQFNSQVLDIASE